MGNYFCNRAYKDDIMFVTSCRFSCLIQARQRVNYEKSRAIYNEDMNEKIKFIMRKNRRDPYPGC